MGARSSSGTHDVHEVLMETILQRGVRVRINAKLIQTLRTLNAYTNDDGDFLFTDYFSDDVGSDWEYVIQKENVLKAMEQRKIGTKVMEDDNAFLVIIPFADPHDYVPHTAESGADPHAHAHPGLHVRAPAPAPAESKRRTRIPRTL
jgi:hypothetical protein